MYKPWLLRHPLQPPVPSEFFKHWWNPSLMSLGAFGRVAGSGHSGNFGIFQVSYRCWLFSRYSVSSVSRSPCFSKYSAAASPDDMMAYILAFTIRLSSSVQGTPGSDKERQRKDNKRVGNNMAVTSPELSNLVPDAGLYIVNLGDGQVEPTSLNKQWMYEVHCKLFVDLNWDGKKL